MKNFSNSKFKNKDLKFDDDKIDSRNVFDKNYKKSAYEWRISEYRGVGFGLSISGLNGIFAFYDYNLEDNIQLHFDLDLTGPQVGGLFKTLRLTNESTNMDSVGKSLSGNYLEINRTLFSSTIRALTKPADWISLPDIGSIVLFKTFRTASRVKVAIVFLKFYFLPLVRYFMLLLLLQFLSS